MQKVTWECFWIYKSTDAMIQDLCIPANSTDFIVNISESLSTTEQHLTLEFLNECLVGFSKSNELMRHLCLDYMAPWLRNLALYTRSTPDDNNKQLSKTKDVLRLLIELTTSRADVGYIPSFSCTFMR